MNTILSFSKQIKSPLRKYDTSNFQRTSILNSKSFSSVVLRRQYGISKIFDGNDLFVKRHIGPRDKDIGMMLERINLKSLDDLVKTTIPSNILLDKDINIGPERGETEFLKELKEMFSENKLYKTFIGMGYSGTILPNVIKRNVLENPGWYTPYTPYQSEISQGRLESLMNFQTMIIDLTGMEICGASLLDEATAAAEAVLMASRTRGPKKNTFFVSHLTHPQTISVIETRCKPYDIKVVVGDASSLSDAQIAEYDGVLFSYPATDGSVIDYKAISDKVHGNKGTVIFAVDLLSLTLLKAPSDFGADIVVGSTQRFGVPMGYGGPHAGYLATNESFKRSMPGRIIGVSKDVNGKVAFRMALGTREQHIRREKATSNICTAQALLANISAMYAVYHGPEGLKKIATSIHQKAKLFEAAVNELGFNTGSEFYFDTVIVNTTKAKEIIKRAEEKGVNLRLYNDKQLTLSFDEVTELKDIEMLVEIFQEFSGGKTASPLSSHENKINVTIPTEFLRTNPILTHEVFSMYHSESEMVRYIHRLQQKDLGLIHSMIPLGSCTMKLNATSEMVPITWEEVGNVHPFAPVDQAQGYKKLIDGFEESLKEITGFDRISFQPNAGSQGEYAGLLAILGYLNSIGQSQRNVCLIPTSAHGTNPASAAMSSMKIVVVKCDEDGNIDVEDMKLKAEKHKEELAAVMITYPSTHGVFEESVKEICEIVHKYGGQVYMDGANMNAQVGLTRPRDIGADVCHLNLHKTFCIPHGGGGPGVGPIGVSDHLAPFLPGHSVIPVDGIETGAVSAAPYGSASILPISYSYVKMMGTDGLKKATQVAILNANYMATVLKEHYDLLYQGPNGMVGHEFIIDLRPFKKHGVDAEDVAKRLMDYSYHAPTLSFPVAGTLMIEPTESESKEELDRFCSAMIEIRKEIQEIVDGKVSETDNVLKNSPHPQETLLKEEWNHPYTREKAAYPLPYLRNSKFWPTIGRIDNVYGDRNLICSCPPIESYM